MTTITAPAETCWEALVDSLHDAVIAVDSDLVVVWANGSAGELCGTAEGDLVGRSLAAIIPVVSRLAAEHVELPTADVVLPRLAGELDDVHVQTPRGVVAVEIHANEVVAGPQTLWSVTIRDVTEINASHATLLDAHRELEEFNRLAIGRELRMVELKREVNELLTELGRNPRYDTED